MTLAGLPPKPPSRLVPSFWLTWNSTIRCWKDAGFGRFRLPCVFEGFVPATRAALDAIVEAGAFDGPTSIGSPRRSPISRKPLGVFVRGAGDVNNQSNAKPDAANKQNSTRSVETPAHQDSRAAGLRSRAKRTSAVLEIRIVILAAL